MEALPISVLKQRDLRPRKRWSQSFLLHSDLARKIVRSAQITSDDTIIEIGPGLGILTTELLNSGGKVIAVEIDRELISLVGEKWGDIPSLQWIEADVLEWKLPQDLPQRERVKVVANLPYHISGAVLVKLFQSFRRISHVTVMLQREVAERLVSQPGYRVYGTLSVLRSFFVRRAQLQFVVPASSFYPEPKVDSAVVSLDLREEIPYADERYFINTVKMLFSHRRKMLRRILRKHGEQVLEKLQKEGLDLNLRPERLTLEDFILITSALSTSIPNYQLS